CELTLGVLWSLTRFAQTDLLTLNSTGVTRHETSLTQCRTQLTVVLHQSAGDAMTDRAGLAEAATALDGHHHIELVFQIHQLKRLLNDHACHFTAEETIQRALVDGDVASAPGQENPGCSSLASTCAVVLCRSHVCSVNLFYSVSACGCCAACGCSLPA